MISKPGPHERQFSIMEASQLLMWVLLIPLLQLRDQGIDKA
jgi:hypothetical protein